MLTKSKNIGKFQPKFERNLCISFRDDCDTDNGRTIFDFMSSADSQAELKISNERPMGLDALLENQNNSNRYVVMYDRKSLAGIQSGLW